MNALAERIYEIRGGTVRHYVGTYEDYVRDLESIMDADDVAVLPKELSDDAEARSLRRQMLKEKQRLAERMQIQIEKLDKEKSGILAYFFENPTDYSPEKNRRLSELDDELSRFEHQWLVLCEEIEMLKAAK